LSESNEHKALVKKIELYVKKETEFLHYQDGLMINKEAGLQSFDEIVIKATADIEISHVEKKIYILGEAKTSMYPLNDKAGMGIRQLNIYIDLLLLNQNSHLIYATPYIDIRHTKFEVSRAIEKRGIPNNQIKTHFIDLDDLYKV